MIFYSLTSTGMTKKGILTTAIMLAIGLRKGPLLLWILFLFFLLGGENNLKRLEKFLFHK